MGGVTAVEESETSHTISERGGESLAGGLALLSIDMPLVGARGGGGEEVGGREGTSSCIAERGDIVHSTIV